MRRGVVRGEAADDLRRIEDRGRYPVLGDLVSGKGSVRKLDSKQKLHRAAGSIAELFVSLGL